MYCVPISSCVTIALSEALAQAYATRIHRPSMNLPKHAELWLPSYLKNRARHLAAGTQPRRLYVAFTDHFEPHGNTTLDVAHLRLATWQNRWPRIAADAPRDAAGKPPCFTFFYPQEEYQRDLLNTIAALTHDGTADVEVHLHHFDDTAPSFVEKMRTFIRTLHEQHGLLHTLHGRLAFAFIHGNWALDNSRPDGLKCGVTGELQLLRDLGCYADFTMPSFPSPTQSRIVNQIYWTTGSPARPRGFDSGIEATPAGGRQGDLLMVTGPLGLRFRDRLLPRFETGELAFYDPPTPARIERWLALAPRIGDAIFLKLYGHSAREDNAAALLGTGPGNPGTLAPMFQWIHQAAQCHQLELHWSSAFSMYRAIESLVGIPPLAAAPLAVEPPQ